MIRLYPLVSSLLSRICQSSGPMIGSVSANPHCEAPTRGTDGLRGDRWGSALSFGNLSFGKIGSLIIALAVALGAAAWIAGFSPSSMVMASVPCQRHPEFRRSLRARSGTNGGELVAASAGSILVFGA